MNHSNLANLLLCIGVGASTAGIASCGAPDGAADGEVDIITAALSRSSIATPVRTRGGTDRAWDRNTIDLMVADTWATCSFVKSIPGGTPALQTPVIKHKVVDPGDRYLDDLSTVMRSAMSNFDPDFRASLAAADQAKWDGSATQLKWLRYRNGSEWNRNSKNEKVSVGLLARDLTKYAVTIADTTRRAIVVNAEANAQEATALAGMNACIAQGVRSQALGGDTLKLTEAEQLHALEIVRERAQLAMLQYAAIFSAVSRRDGSFPTTTNAFNVVAYLQSWAQSTNATDATNRTNMFGTWAKDFAAAAQLHVTATQELSDLFARSASARTARGGRIASLAQDEWGPGSWRQRLLALLYGGDPLAEEPDGSTPWRNIVDSQAPGVPIDTSIRLPDPWPTPKELPFFTIENRDPKVAELWGLARRLDEIRIKNKADKTVDVENTASWIYRNVEAQLLTERCAQGMTTTTPPSCKVVPLSSVPSWSAGIDNFLVWSVFGITKDAARTLARILDQYAPSSGVGPIHIVGALRTVADGVTTARVIPRAHQEMPRTLFEIAPLFARYAPYRIPLTANPNVEVAHLESAPQVSGAPLTYRIGDDQGISAGGMYADAMRVFGAIPALSVTRDVINAVNAASTTPAQLKTALANIAPSLNSAISSAIGSRTVRFVPAEEVIPYNWGLTITNGRQTFERLQKVVIESASTVRASWNVEVDVPSDDVFFQTASNTFFDVVAVRDDATAYPLAYDPTARRASDGLGIGDLAANTNKDLVVISSATIANGKLTSTVDLRRVAVTASAAPPQWSLLVRKRVGTDTTKWEYLPLAGPIPVASWSFALSVRVAPEDIAPIFSTHIAAGGTLGALARRVWTVRRTDPARPAYDGFGLRYNWVPSADATAFGSEPGDSVMSYFLRNAKTAAAEATEAVRTAIESSFQEAQAQADADAATSRTSLVTQQEIRRLCPKGDTLDCMPSMTTVNLFRWTPIDPGAWTASSGIPSK